jgi:hypothetical protein
MKTTIWSLRTCEQHVLYQATSWAVRYQLWRTKQLALIFFWDAISEAFTLVCIKRHVSGRVGAEGHLKCSILERKPAMAKISIDRLINTDASFAAI